ncbi:MAG: alanine racemase C-terminal domain-containing protein [Polyangiales bacterium]
MSGRAGRPPRSWFDLGPEGTAYNGDEVVLLGREGDREITCEELAAWSDTITHDVLVSINTRVPRVYVG